jgi:hypothetical protein
MEKEYNTMKLKPVAFGVAGIVFTKGQKKNLAKAVLPSTDAGGATSVLSEEVLRGTQAMVKKQVGFPIVYANACIGTIRLIESLNFHKAVRIN